MTTKMRISRTLLLVLVLSLLLTTAALAATNDPFSFSFNYMGEICSDTANKSNTKSYATVTVRSKTSGLTALAWIQNSNGIRETTEQTFSATTQYTMYYSPNWMDGYKTLKASGSIVGGMSGVWTP